MILRTCHYQSWNHIIIRSENNLEVGNVFRCLDNVRRIHLNGSKTASEQEQQERSTRKIREAKRADNRRESQGKNEREGYEAGYEAPWETETKEGYSKADRFKGRPKKGCEDRRQKRRTEELDGAGVEGFGGLGIKAMISGSGAIRANVAEILTEALDQYGRIELSEEERAGKCDGDREVDEAL